MWLLLGLLLSLSIAFTADRCHHLHRRPAPLLLLLLQAFASCSPHCATQLNDNTD
jgi:hypothetical protein